MLRDELLSDKVLLFLLDLLTGLFSEVFDDISLLALVERRPDPETCCRPVETRSWMCLSEDELFLDLL